MSQSEIPVVPPPWRAGEKEIERLRTQIVALERENESLRADNNVWHKFVNAIMVALDEALETPTRKELERRLSDFVVSSSGFGRGLNQDDRGSDDE